MLNMIIASPKYKHQKQNSRGDHSRRNRFLITVNVLGSSGPLRFIVNQDDLVGSVIHTALKSYAKEGRLPVLGKQANDFLLYCANAGFDALSPSARIGSQGVRNFMLCKKQRQLQMTDRKPSNLTAQKGTSCWKSWLTKPFAFKLNIPFMR